MKATAAPATTLLDLRKGSVITSKLPGDKSHDKTRKRRYVTAVVLRTAPGVTRFRVVDATSPDWELNGDVYELPSDYRVTLDSPVILVGRGDFLDRARMTPETVRALGALAGAKVAGERVERAGRAA